MAPILEEGVGAHAKGSYDLLWIESPLEILAGGFWGNSEILQLRDPFVKYADASTKATLQAVKGDSCAMQMFVSEDRI